MLIVSCLKWLTCLVTHKWWDSKAPTYYFIEEKVKYNDIYRLQTLVFYFSYNVSTVTCNATPTLLRDSKSTFHTRNVWA